MKFAPALALSLLLASCEIRIGTDGNSGVFFSSFSVETSGHDGGSVFLRGKGSYSMRNGRVTKLGEGSRVYFLRHAGKPEESEIFALRQGGAFETAVLRQGKVETLGPSDKEWLEEKLNTAGLEVLPSPGIDAENERLTSLRKELAGNSADWQATAAKLKESIFPWAVLPEILQFAQRETISAEDEKGLLTLVSPQEPLFRHRDRDRIVETLVSRANLSGASVASILANLDAVSYGKRTEIAQKLLTKSSFDSIAAQGLLDSIDEIPYDGRADILAAMRSRGELCSDEDWLDAVLDEAPYDRRTRLVLDALASPAPMAGSGAGSGKLARATLARLDDFPYDRRSAIFSQCVQASFDKDEAAKLVDRVFDDIPYNERRRILESMAEHPTLGATVVREVIRRIDDLPYDSRDDFLIAAAKRSDLTANDQVRIVRQTVEEVSHSSRAKVLKTLLANPLCSAEAKEAIWRHRKDLPSAQREEIEELLHK